MSSRFDRSRVRLEKARARRARLYRRFRPLWAYTYPSVPEGWFPILELLCKKLERDAGGRLKTWVDFLLWHVSERWNNAIFRWVFGLGRQGPTSRWERLLLSLAVTRGMTCFTDAKEKYGRLTLSGAFTKRMWRRVDAAERLSLTTCQECGKRGTLVPEGWWHVTCAKHASPSDLEYLASLKTGLQRAIDKLP